MTDTKLQSTADQHVYKAIISLLLLCGYKAYSFNLKKEQYNLENICP
jgi:hypothetical protein